MGNDQIAYNSLPIPTYEEAIASQPGSSRLSVIDDDDPSAEREALLQHHVTNDDRPSRRDGYHHPTVEDERDSLDFIRTSNDDHSTRESMEELQRELHQMEVDDGSPSSSSSMLRSNLSLRWTKQLNSLSRTLSAIHTPLRKYIPRFSFPTSFRWDFWSVQVREDGQTCIFALRLVGILIVVSLVYLLFVSDIFTFGNRFQGFEPLSVQNYIQSNINKSSIREKLEKATAYTHVAGTEGNYVLAEWIQDEFIRANLEEVTMEEFQVYLNYPRVDGRRVAIVHPPELAWQAALDEEQVYTDPPREQSLAFHGHSKSGNVTGPLIYANYGSREDFKYLADRGVSLDGAIVLVRYYGTQGDRALKIKAAELAGAAGCIIYSDPAEDGFRRGNPYPDGRFMPKDGVQRGAVSMMSWVVGDVLSPGFASTPDEKHRISPAESTGLNKIPSIPIAWRDAQHLLQALQGHGSTVPKEWVGGVPKVDEWWTGDQSSPQVNLMNLQDEVERQPIYNVVGRITGYEQPEKKIIVGNHRDSWCFGAADPGSGTAVFLEVIRVFGELRNFGWRPRRTIEFASWDGEEYNLIGSTEHVENDLSNLQSHGVAYLNVDVGVSGNDFQASASPLFREVLYQVLGRVADVKAEKTLKQLWEEKDKKLEGLGAGSDYVAFQDIAGTSSIDLGFGGAIYPYHSCYENFEWMTKFGDPDFEYHNMLGEVWGLLIWFMSDHPLVPFDFQAYAESVATYVVQLEDWAKLMEVPLSSSSLAQRESTSEVDFTALYEAVTVFKAQSDRFSAWSLFWYNAMQSSNFENNIMRNRRLQYNTRAAEFETNLLDLSAGGGVC